MKKSPLSAIAIGLVVFALVLSIKIFIGRFVPAMTAFARQVMLELLLGIASVILARWVFHVPDDTFDIRKGFVKKIARRYALRAFVLGILATATLLLFHASGIPMMKQLPLGQLLLVLFMASVSEELLSRGLVQGIAGSGAPVVAGRLRISPAVLAGALVFSLIHLSIYISGGDYLTTAIVMLYAFVLGIAAGKAKEQSNLGAAILVHLSFNAGGIAGGIMINLVSMIATGHPVHQ